MILFTAIGCKDSKKLVIRLVKLRLQKETYTVVNDSAKWVLLLIKQLTKRLLEVYLRDNIDEYQTRRNSIGSFEWCNLAFQ
jgi:hypothetical protein